MPTEDKLERTQEEEEAEYLGNIWGWKFSLIGLAVISFLIIVVIIRWNNLEVKPDNLFTPEGQKMIIPVAPTVLQPKDTLKANQK